MRSKSFALLLLVVLPACPDITLDMNEGSVPSVEFDPTNSIIPFPSDLVRDPLTGKVSIPAPACESPASMQVRTQVLNTLDGFGTYEVGLQATMTASADPSTLTGNVIMYKRLAGSAQVPVASAMPVPISVTASQTLRYNASDCSSPATIPALTIVPQVPLDPDSTYTVAITSSVMTSSSTSFYPSFVWSLVRQSDDPVTVEAGCTPTPTSNCAITGDLTPIAPGTPANDAELQRDCISLECECAGADIPRPAAEDRAEPFEHSARVGLHDADHDGDARSHGHQLASGWAGDDSATRLRIIAHGDRCGVWLGDREPAGMHRVHECGARWHRVWSERRAAVLRAR